MEDKSCQMFFFFFFCPFYTLLSCNCLWKNLKWESALTNGCTEVCLHFQRTLFTDWSVFFHSVTLSRLSLKLSPTKNRSSWSTARTPPHPPAQQAPRHLLSRLQEALQPGQTVRAQTKEGPFHLQHLQRRAKTSSAWGREWRGRLILLWTTRGIKLCN